MRVADKIQYYKECCPTLLSNGYVAPIPLKEEDKTPFLKKWNTMPVTPQLTSRWINRYSRSNVGLRTGDQTHHGALAAIDVDISIAGAADSVLEAIRYFIGEHVLIRYGEAPKLLVPIRVEEPLQSEIFHLVPQPHPKGSPKIELLCHNKQFVAFGIHPDTKNEYRWLDNRSPLNVPFKALPLVPIDTLQSILDYL